MISITRIFSFSASHLLPYHEGPCNRHHGHNYKLEVSILGKLQDKGPSRNMVMDFGDLDGVVEQTILKKLDHRHLNEFFHNPTAEAMVEWMAARIQAGLPVNEFRLQVRRLKLWETEKCYAEWEPDN